MGITKINNFENTSLVEPVSNITSNFVIYYQDWVEKILTEETLIDLGINLVAAGIGGGIVLGVNKLKKVYQKKKEEEIEKNIEILSDGWEYLKQSITGLFQLTLGKTS